MGRVARYKKLKACDPFSKHSAKEQNGLESTGVLIDPRLWTGSKQQKKLRKMKRNEKNGGGGATTKNIFDTAPDEEDDFDMSDILNVRKQKRQKLPEEDDKMDMSVPVRSDNIPNTDKDEAKVARILRTDSRSMAKKQEKATKFVGRMKGESMNAFNIRVKQETRKIMLTTEQGKKSTTKMEKKKSFLNNKKKKNKRGNNRYPSDDEDERHNSSSGAEMVTVTRDTFGQTAERPPTFNVIPRGAKRKTHSSTRSTAESDMDDQKRKAEQRTMEIMRKRVIAQYAIMKEKRKKGLL